MAGSTVLMAAEADNAGGLDHALRSLPNPYAAALPGRLDQVPQSSANRLETQEIRHFSALARTLLSKDEAVAGSFPDGPGEKKR
jgi:hypothetical protein